MRALLDFLHEYEIFLYILIGLISIIYIRRFLTAWQEARLAIFGLEREMSRPAHACQCLHPGWHWWS